MYLYLFQKYWTKHKVKALKMMFAGILMTAIIVVAFFQFRAIYNHTLHRSYDRTGMYDIMIPDTSDKLLQEIASVSDNNKTGRIYATGKDGIGLKQYTCGFLDDKYGLAHIPLEKGRSPERNGEVAIARYVLNQFCWAGSIGDTIELDSGTYIVSGILGNDYGDRIQTEINIMALDGAFIPDKPLPVIIFDSGSTKDIKHCYYMFDGISLTNDEEIAHYTDLIYNELGEEIRLCSINSKKLINDNINKNNTFRYDVRWILILSGISTVIAILSVISVLRIIISDRKNNITILRRLGTSRKQIIIMHITECAVFTAVQTAIGAICGALAYYAISRYQKNVIGLDYYDGFAKDKYIIRNTYDPYFVAIIFSAAIMVTAYLMIGLSCIDFKRFKARRIMPDSIPVYYSRIFRQSIVTMMQFISLTLIGFGVLLGYMYYTDNGKVFMSGLSYFPAGYEINNGFDLKKDNIAEYYSALQPAAVGVEAYNTGKDTLLMADGDYELGVDDAVISKLGDVTATGDLKQTFIISESKDEEYNSRIKFLHDDEKSFIIENSLPEYKNFFDEGQLGAKYLYRAGTKLSNKENISKLESYVTAGSINYDNLNSGSEIIVVTHSRKVPFKVGETINIGSISSNNYYGIEDITESYVKIGAVITLNDEIDKILNYSVANDDGYNFLTTVYGARNLGLHNAAYTEIFSSGHVDGGQFPSNAGITMISYEEIKSQIRRDKMLRFGGVILVTILMSLLGFAAYFSSIGLKIQTKKYQISILRSLGDSMKHIRLHLLIGNLMIPFISCLAAACSTSAVKHITKRKFGEFTNVFNEWASGSVTDPDAQDKKFEKMNELKEKYFLENELWKVPTGKITAVVFGIMVAVTLILTAAALLKYKGGISEDINKVRKRT